MISKMISRVLSNDKSTSNAPAPPIINTSQSPQTSFDPLSAAVVTAQERYTLANSKSSKAHEDACHDMPGGNTRTVLHSSPFPLTFIKGEGCELTSSDGKVYIDFLGEYTAGIYGHSNSKIQDAVAEALRLGWNFGGPNEYERKLAQKVIQRFAPSGMHLVRFTNSGTEANTMAIATAIAFTRRKKVLVFANGYHGGTIYFAPGHSINVNLPHDFVIAPYNDIAGMKAVVDHLPKDSLAAILVELVQGSGGCIVGTKEFLQELDRTAHRLGALFIVDEVMTSRLSYHGLSSELGLKPDLITLGKWVGGGMTFGAFGGRRDVMGMFDPRDGVLSHSGTFNNNIVTMAAGCAGLDVYGEAEVQHLNALGECIKIAVEGVLATNDVSGPTSPRRCPQKNELESPFTGIQSEKAQTNIAVEEVTDDIGGKKPPGMWISGRGSMLAVHFCGDSEQSLKSLFWHHMIEKGIYMAQRCFIALNLELSSQHSDLLIDAVREFVEKYKTALKA